MVSLAGMDGMLVYVAWVGSVARLRGWRAYVDRMLVLMSWMAC